METQIIPPGETAPITVSPQPQSMERRGRNLRMPIEQEELPFAEAWRILRKRRALILKVTCVCLALAISYTVIATPKYRSESTIEFNKQNSDSLALDEQRGMLADTSSMDYIVTQQTQVKAMLSDTLALRVIRELNLTSHFEKLSTSVPRSRFEDCRLRGQHAGAGLQRPVFPKPIYRNHGGFRLAFQAAR
jgi:hypothetical protein